MIQKMADYLGVSPKAVIIGIVGFIIEIGRASCRERV